MPVVDLASVRWSWSRPSDPVPGPGPAAVSWTCGPGTDFWRLTHSGQVAHSGHACTALAEGDLEIEARFDADLVSRYDQVGLVALQTPTVWFKGGFELDGRVHVGGVTTRETSDWSLQPVNAPGWLRLTRRAGTLELFQRDGDDRWVMVRRLTLEGPVSVGFYSAAPLGPGFTASLTALHCDLAD